MKKRLLKVYVNLIEMYEGSEYKNKHKLRETENFSVRVEVH